MRVSELKKEMDEQFLHMKEQFAEVATQFAQVNARFERVDAQFDELERRIVAEGEATRRHFDLVAEQFRAEVGLERRDR
jgi:septal ring factor EnvC (AmiA/AmiB activator)